MIPRRQPISVHNTMQCVLVENNLPSGPMSAEVLFNTEQRVTQLAVLTEVLANRDTEMASAERLYAHRPIRCNSRLALEQDMSGQTK